MAPKTPQESRLRPLEQRERELVQRLFSHGEDFPPEFFAYLKGRFEVDPPNIMPSSVANLHGEDWQLVGGGGGLAAFANNWANFGGGNVVAGYRMLASGQVELRGLVANPGGPLQGNGTVAWTLPTRYHPLAGTGVIYLPARGIAAGAGHSGVVSVGPAGGAAAGQVLITLDGVAANAAVASFVIAGIYTP